MKNDDSEKVGRLEAAPRYKTKVCQRCGEKYLPTGRNQKFCVECKPHAKTAREAAYSIAHRFQRKPEQRRAGREKFNLAHPGYRKNYYWANPEKARAAERAQYAAHPEYSKAWVAAHPERANAAYKKHAAKRRSLGWNPLNAPFPDSNGHHINETDVIYMPRKLHRSIYHDLWTGQGMEEINALAENWLIQERT